MSVLTSVKSFLTAAGQDFKKGVAAFVKYVPSVVGLVAGAEKAAEPILALAFPGIAPEVATVTQTIFAAVLAIEQKFAGMGQQTGTGTQKLAEVFSIVGPVAMSALQKLGLDAGEASITAWINAVVSFLNGIPAGSAPSLPAPAAATK